MQRPRGAWRLSSAAWRSFLVSPDWEPLYPMHNYGVYASRWPLGQRDGVDDRESHRVRRERRADGGAVHAGHALLRSLSWRGVEAAQVEGEDAMLSFPMEATATARFWPRRASRARRLQSLMQRMAAMTAEAAGELTRMSR